MSVTGGTSSQTKFFSSGQIKFSELRTTFNSNAGSNNIRFSTYRRNTDLNETDPIVPDSTENRTTVSASEGISTQDDLKIVSFRNSIKQYVVTQSSSNTEVTIHSGSGAGSRWNANLDKNVKKFFNVNGTIDADSPSDDAAVFDAEAYNLTIDVTGNIYGEGGTGGSAMGDGSGGNGGDALYVNNTSSRSGNSAKVIVKVNSNGRIWAGGGGGAAGGAGNSGNDLNCYNTVGITTQVYGGDPTNPGRACNRNCKKSLNILGTVYDIDKNGSCYGVGDSRSRCRGRQERGQTCTSAYYRNCSYKTTFIVGGGNGGNGGNGGVGEGANNNQGNGNDGNAGNTNNCSANETSSKGNDGNPGASGGTWGVDGGNAGNISGGTKGRAVFRGNGNTFFLNGQSSNNVKGTVSGKV